MKPGKSSSGDLAARLLGVKAAAEAKRQRFSNLVALAAGPVMAVLRIRCWWSGRPYPDRAGPGERDAGGEARHLARDAVVCPAPVPSAGERGSR